MDALNTGLPSTRKIQSLIKEEQAVELKLLTNDILEGKIIWQDHDCLCLVDNSEQSTLIWRRALVYLKPKQ